MASVDYWRQLGLFPPRRFKKPITVIGAGATGSYIAYMLAKMGCRDITVCDFDIVEDYNLPNQMFGLQDIGAKKVEAMSRIIKEQTGTQIKMVCKAINKAKLKGIVFVLTDTMKSRKGIWLSSLKNKKGVELVIETRMGIDNGRIYTIVPTDKKQIKFYESTLYSDKEAQPSPCTRTAIAPTVATIGGMAIFNLINFFNGKSYPYEILLSLDPCMVISKKY